MLCLEQGYQGVPHQQLQGFFRKTFIFEKGALDLSQLLWQLNLQYFFDLMISGPPMILTPLIHPLTHFNLPLTRFHLYNNFGIIYVFVRRRRSLLLYLHHLFLLSDITFDSHDLFSEVGSLLLQRDYVLHDVDEHAGLEEGLAGVVLETHDHHFHAEALLSVPDAVYEVTVTRK